MIPLFAFTQSEENPNDLIYKFSVNNITDMNSAKQVQLGLLQDTLVSSCWFIDGCDCFKLKVSSFMSYSDLKNILSTSGYQLSGDVSLSDGRVLKEITINQSTK